MSRAPLLVLLAVTLGCATTPPAKPGEPTYDPELLPSLPASHAHLSQQLTVYARAEGALRWQVHAPPGGAASVAAAGRCDEAKAEQRRALELLPPGWPAPERERLRATLADYEAGCTALPWSARLAPDTRMVARHPY